MSEQGRPGGGMGLVRRNAIEDVKDGIVVAGDLADAEDAGICGLPTQ